MKKVFLFDWGDTLMRDLPGMSGKMCDWPDVEVIDGAKELLASLSEEGEIYVTSGAESSNHLDMKAAFSRVGLDSYIKGYFCKTNLHLKKGSPAFLLRLLMHIQAQPAKVTVIGDNFQKDILPALALGMTAVWFTKPENQCENRNVRVIHQLAQLNKAPLSEVC